MIDIWVVNQTGTGSLRDNSNHQISPAKNNSIFDTVSFNDLTQHYSV